MISVLDFESCIRPPIITVWRSGVTTTVLAERVLMGSVVADDPIAPEGRHGVNIKGETLPTLGSSVGSCGSGIECMPAGAGEVGLDPGMRVFGADDVVSGEIVELVAAESGDHAGRNAQRAQHDRHRRCEVLAVSLLAFEKKIRNRIFDGGGREFERVTEASPEIVLDGRSLVEIVAGGTCDLNREAGNARIERGKPQVSGREGSRIVASGRA